MPTWYIPDIFFISSFTWNVYESYPFSMNVETRELLFNAESVGDGDSRHFCVHESIDVNDLALDGSLIAQLNRCLPAYRRTKGS